MSNEFTNDEGKAIRRLKSALSKMPSTLKVYVVDDSVFVCKVGVSSFELAEFAGTIETPCSVLSDVHP
ncbi:uncharacterized protein NMK_2466 [Novimethylophilus kurashikiensis]|uniref:Uncharacterized protein n=1 Tax=Novimethylophilus kurashikiensis TaxID=1825523 RepID=A0A2R5FA00_9PROT|nr:hypothetical protein [Novimethylophilus kurashikiensis]GBG14865.1 uncharacterized protein NMK_2466 [Novimethylophilus kurashikiensis]